MTTGSLFSNPILPLASEGDARDTCRVAFPRIADVGGTATVVHVIEKAGGGIDKAGVEQRELVAEEIFDVARDVAEEFDVDVETKIVFGTDVPEAIFDAATAVDASAIVFTARGGSRWIRLLTGDTALDLITDNDRPVVALPRPTDPDADAEESVESDDEPSLDDDPAATANADESSGDPA